MLVFELSQPGRVNRSQVPVDPTACEIPAELLRSTATVLPELSELDAVRHYTRLSQQNFSIDTHFYPLGSCTMKYNPRVNELVARLEGMAWAHPYQPEALSHRTGPMR